MFSYYRTYVENQPVYFQIGTNPYTRVFEFYMSKDLSELTLNVGNLHWKKFNIDSLSEVMHFNILVEHDQLDIKLNYLDPQSPKLNIKKYLGGQEGCLWTKGDISLNLAPIEEKDLPPTLVENCIKPSQEPFQGMSYMSMQMLGLFGAVLGTAAVALALFVLSGGALAAVAGVGAVFMLTGMGLFAYGTYQKSKSDELDSELDLIFN